MKTFVFLFLLGFSMGAAEASVPHRKKVEAQLSDQLLAIRSKIAGQETQLIDALKRNQEVSQNLVRIRTILSLQKEEASLSTRRMKELETTLSELEKRRGILREHIMVQQTLLRKRFQDLARAFNEIPQIDLERPMPESEKLYAPRAYVISKMSEKGLREVEELKADLEDSMRIETKIRDEQNQLTYMAHELEEQESVLKLNQELQADLLRRKHQDRLTQIENYRKLKSAEQQVEGLIREFNSRMELHKNVEAERQMTARLYELGTEGGFVALKGRLLRPVGGKVVSQFGKAFDPKSRLQIFRKGIEITTSPYDSVRAIAAGNVAFVGFLPNYGNLIIVDHGQNYYSLAARLGAFQKKKGEAVTAGEVIAQANDAGSPVYFEIRARNVAVNPLQWLSN